MNNIFTKPELRVAQLVLENVSPHYWHDKWAKVGPNRHENHTHQIQVRTEIVTDWFDSDVESGPRMHAIIKVNGEEFTLNAEETRAFYRVFLRRFNCPEDEVNTPTTVTHLRSLNVAREAFG
jgi:hypothetical protein